MRLVLASQSPRRKELLGILGIPFTIVLPSVDEAVHPDEAPDEYAARVARMKGLDVASRLSDSVILSADTVVTVDGEILGKPKDTDDAVVMLERLAGRRHRVYTAVCVVNQGLSKITEGIDGADVVFRNMTLKQIRDYVRREDVLDKAGAYGIQGYASVYIPRIEGNYTTVMGLPLPLVYNLLAETGVWPELSG